MLISELRRPIAPPTPFDRCASLSAVQPERLDQSIAQVIQLMSYQSRNRAAQAHPLRSIATFRSLSVLGEAFAAGHASLDLSGLQAVRTLEMARIEVGNAREAYDQARAALGEVNRMGTADRHDRAITSDRYVTRRRREAFGVLNRRRGRLVRAGKALTAAELTTPAG